MNSEPFSPSDRSPRSHEADSEISNLKCEIQPEQHSAPIIHQPSSTHAIADPLPATDHGPQASDVSRSHAPTFSSSPLHRRPITHQGKVARLPATVRNQVCKMMYDGTRYKAIIAWLAENGHPGIQKCNLSRWREGGYQDWLNAQQWLEHRDFKRELATEQANNDDPAFHDAGVYLAQIQFYEALNRLDGSELSNLVRENRKEFLQLLKTFTHFNRYCLQREKFRNDLQQQNKAEQAHTKSAKRPFRKATMERLCDDLNLK